MSTDPTPGVGASHAKRRLKRKLYETFRNDHYSRPELHGLDTKLEPDITNISMRGGFFAEAVANEGYAQSNTYYFVNKHRWSGLLIELLSELAAHSRPESTVIESALDHERQDAFFQCAQQLKPHTIGASTEVEVRSLGSVINKHAPNRAIDLLSLDVEGFEPQALAGLDPAQQQPRFISDEANDPDAIDAMLGEHYDLLDTLRETCP